MSIEDLKPTSVKLNAEVSVENNYGKAIKVIFHWKEKIEGVYTEVYTKTATKGEGSMYSVSVDDLKADKSYEYWTTVQIGGVLLESSKYEFTAPGFQVSFSNLRVSDLGTYKATLNANVNIEDLYDAYKAKVTIIYRAKGYSEQSYDYTVIDTPGTIICEKKISGLKRNTSYEFRVCVEIGRKAASTYFAKYESEIAEFKTNSEPDVVIGDIELVSVLPHAAVLKTSVAFNEKGTQGTLGVSIKYRKKGDSANYETESCEYMSSGQYQIEITGLDINTEYECYVQAYNMDTYIYDSNRLFYFKTAPRKEVTYVDLGLSVYWASINVGAEKPEDLGTEYKIQSTYGDIVQKTEKDPATQNWGLPWRLPTKIEAEELVTQCTWQYVTQNDVLGYKITGTNGNSIFLPTESNSSMYIWTGSYSHREYYSSWSADYYYCIHSYLNNNREIIKTVDDRDTGSSTPVRPVLDK